MASITDFILKQTTSQASGINIPANLKNQVLGGLSNSIIGSLTQTASQPSGFDQIKELLTGKTSAAASPITGLATNLFSQNIIQKLGLDSKLGGALSALIPGIVGKLSGFIKDQDGDGDVDINDIILSLKGGNAKSGSGILGAATSILGGLFKK
ncbi:MAG: hypothetical protein Q4F39_01765 [Bacteroidia bacterium]|nr:hypothetical protein [Bacteroidia bacterium]